MEDLSHTLSAEDRIAMLDAILDLALADKLFIAICEYSGLEVLVLERYGKELDILPL